MIIALCVYLYALLCVCNLVIATDQMFPRTGWDLALRIIFAPVLLPIFILYHILKGR